MSDRFALLIGLDDIPDAPALPGARHDVDDLRQSLLGLGVAPGHIRVHTSHGGAPATLAAVREGLAWLAAHLDDETTALIHVSGRGTTTADGPALVLADGSVLPVCDLHDAFADTPVRSVLTVLDVGFSGGGRALPGERPWLTVPTPSGDPVLTAHGPCGPVREHRIGGQPRGVLSWSLARALETLDDPSWTFDVVLRTLRRLQGAVRAAQQPHLVPAGLGDRPLGSFVDGLDGHIPWRGVEVHYQWVDHHGIILHNGSPVGAFGVSSPQDFEQWLWQSGPNWPDAFEIRVDGLSAPPEDPAAIRFTNNGFGGTPSSTPPQVGPQDKIFSVQAPSLGGDECWLIVRGGVDNPTAVDWYTTYAATYLPLNQGDVLTFATHPALPGDWDQKSWYNAHEPRKP